MSKYKLPPLSFIILIALGFIQSGCNNSMKEYHDSIYTPDIYDGSGYNLSTPDRVYDLNPALNEISGLSYLSENLLLSVQDEHGIMYVIDLNDGNISHRVRFAKSGDYEGIALVGNAVVIIKSDGQIYRFDLDMNSNEAESELLTTSLTSRNDVEGLTYDKSSDRLLIACKGKGEVDQNAAKGKCIYEFDLQSLKLIKDPVSSIKKKDVAKFIDADYPNFKLDDGIGPSGIAIHPISGKTYILAHDGKALIVLNGEGKIEKYNPLNPSLFRQPEGICFNDQGDLFISNEANYNRPNIMKFSYQK